DTANAYRNERAVGRGIKKANVKREDIFISTKLWPSEYENPNAVDETLERLDLDYIDLLFIHQPTKNWREGYKQLIKAYNDGKIKAIGVSNFEGEYINDLLNEFDVYPQVIQVECHPFYPQTELREIIKEKDIKIMSWYPLGGKGMTSELLNSDIIKSLSNKYNKTPAQIVLRWHLDMGFIVIPGSKNKDHIKDNINIFDFKLSKEDMNEISKLNNNQRRYIRTDEALENFLNWKVTYEVK
nr:aldo/keto reductase [Acholeplasmatales bacterium]